MSFKKKNTTHLTVLICQRRLRLRVRSDYGIGRTVRLTRHVVATRRGGRVVSLIAHRRDVETLVPETRRVKCLKIEMIFIKKKKTLKRLS